MSYQWQTSPFEMKVAQLQDFRGSDKLSALAVWCKHCIFKTPFIIPSSNSSQHPQQKQGLTQSWTVCTIFSAGKRLQHTQVLYLNHQFSLFLVIQLKNPCLSRGLAKMTSGRTLLTSSFLWLREKKASLEETKKNRQEGEGFRGWQLAKGLMLHREEQGKYTFKRKKTKH